MTKKILPVRTWASCPSVLLVVAGVLAFGWSSFALEGDFTPETREKLAKAITIEEENASLGDVMAEIAEQSGLSFAASTLVARLPEPVAIIARDAPAGEVVAAVAFSMHLDFRITPGGVVSLRIDNDDPRREALLRRMFPPPHEGRHADGPPPRLDEEEVVERVADHPKVRALLDKLDAELVPAEFHPEKRVWVLLIRREDDEDEEPLGRVIAGEDGELMHIKSLRKDKRRRRGPEPKPKKPKRKEVF